MNYLLYFILHKSLTKYILRNKLKSFYLNDLFNLHFCIASSRKYVLNSEWKDPTDQIIDSLLTIPMAILK
jgi:hypothetical protein